MTRLASRFGAANLIRRDRPLTREELFRVVPSVFREDKHTSRSQNYTYIPTITVLESLQREGFQPFFACQTRARPGPVGDTQNTCWRLRRAGEINGEHVPEIILLNSHDGTQLPDAAGLLQVRLPERVRLWSVSGEVRSAPGKCRRKLSKGLTRWWGFLTG